MIFGSIGVPVVRYGAKTWLHGVAEGADDQTIEIFSAIFDDGVGASASMGNVLYQVCVTTRAETE